MILDKNNVEKIISLENMSASNITIQNQINSSKITDKNDTS